MYQTPQNEVLQVSDPAERSPAGIRPRRTKSCRYQTSQNEVLQVSDHAEFRSSVYSRIFFCRVRYPAEQNPVGSDAPQNKVLRYIISCGIKSCGAWYLAELSPAGYHTPRNEILWGLIYPVELSPVGFQNPRSNFKSQISPRIWNEFEHFLGCESGAHTGSIHEKRR